MLKKHHLTSFAKNMRNNPTIAEQQLWWVLKNEKSSLGKFRRQQPFGKKFIADFMSPEHKLVIEIDGAGHNSHKDEIRDRFMQQEGYRVLKFTSNDVLSRMPYVIKTIAATIVSTPSVALRAPAPPSRGSIS